LVVDEINRVNGDVESRLMAIIDTVASSSFENPDTGEIIKPQPGFSVVATMNGEPEDLSPAVRDRLVVRVEITEAHPDAINVLPENLRALAKHYTSAEVGRDRYSMRSFIAFHELYKASGNLETSAHAILPGIAESVIDASVLMKAEVDNVKA
jgi:MoxR-like ATPase